MPELPEVETVVNSLQKISNTTITKFIPIWKKICYNHDLNNIKKIIPNKKILSITRKGKNIIINLESIHLIFQLRMTGYLYQSNKLPLNMKYVRCYFSLSDNNYLIFEDIRKFGGFYIFNELDVLINRIGIDPFEEKFTTLWLKKNIIKKNRRLKGLLLDQTFICGLGNIYIDEILWKSKIHPLKSSNTLTSKEINLLHKSIVSILTHSIKYHGTTIINFKFDNMKTGSYKSQLKIYGRDGYNCYRCNSKIKKIKIAGRGTHICDTCQII